MNEAALYPGIGAIEGTNISVGRGTDTPFEQIGAPWIDGVQLAGALNARALPASASIRCAFTPASSKYAGEECHGVFMIVTDRAALRPVRVGLEIASALDAHVSGAVSARHRRAALWLARHPDARQERRRSGGHRGVLGRGRSALAAAAVEVPVVSATAWRRSVSARAWRSLVVCRRRRRRLFTYIRSSAAWTSGMMSVVSAGISACSRC